MAGNLGGKGPILANRRLVDLQVHFRLLFSQCLQQIVVDQPMLGGHFGGSVHGHAATDPPCLSHYHGNACHLQPMGA
jgi:hypothetical protein